jgi:CBS domain-containing protein
MKVKEVLQAKGYNEIWSIAPNATVLDALKVMYEKNVGALLVIEGGRLAGIITERDYARKVALQGKSTKNTFVADIMTRDVYGVQSDLSIEESMMLMTEKKIRHLPVFENDNLIGIISIGNVVKSIIINQERLIEDLSGYITGKYIHLPKML